MQNETESNETDSAVEQALEDQQTLAESSLGAIFEAFDEAIEDGVGDPIVFVIDCEDTLGAEIARAWLGDEVVDQAIAVEAVAAGDDESEGRTTVFVAAFSLADCREQATRIFPYLADFVADPPADDGAPVVSITSGGASALTAPFDARP